MNRKEIQAGLLIIGGSDAGISAALRAREMDSSLDVTVVTSDDFPNFSLCGLPSYISGEIRDWRSLATGPKKSWKRGNPPFSQT